MPMESENVGWRFFTVPNLLSVFRLLLVVPGAILLARNEIRSDIWVLVIFLVGVLSDTFDGYLAHRLNQVSRFGLIIDPLSDKVALLTAITIVTLTRGFPLWAACLFIFRDLAIMTGAALILKNNQRVLRARIASRIAVAAEAITLILFIINIPSLWRPVLYLTIIPITVSIIDYAAVFYGSLRNYGSGASR